MSETLQERRKREKREYVERYTTPLVKCNEIARREAEASRKRNNDIATIAMDAITKALGTAPDTSATDEAMKARGTAPDTSATKKK